MSPAPQIPGPPGHRWISVVRNDGELPLSRLPDKPGCPPFLRSPSQLPPVVRRRPGGGPMPFRWPAPARRTIARTGVAVVAITVPW